MFISRYAGRVDVSKRMPVKVASGAEEEDL